MTQFTCKGVKQINNRISFKHLYHWYLSAFFISTGVPNGEFLKYWSQNVGQDFIVLDFFVEGRSCWRKRCVREINVSRAWDPVHVGDKALTLETPAKRGRVNRYAKMVNVISRSEKKEWNTLFLFIMGKIKNLCKIYTLYIGHYGSIIFHELQLTLANKYCVKYLSNVI